MPPGPPGRARQRSNSGGKQSHFAEGNGASWGMPPRPARPVSPSVAAPAETLRGAGAIAALGLVRLVAELVKQAYRALERTGDRDAERAEVHVHPDDGPPPAVELAVQGVGEVLTCSM